MKIIITLGLIALANAIRVPIWPAENEETSIETKQKEREQNIYDVSRPRSVNEDNYHHTSHFDASHARKKTKLPKSTNLKTNRKKPVGIWREDLRNSRNHKNLKGGGKLKKFSNKHDRVYATRQKKPHYGEPEEYTQSRSYPVVRTIDHYVKPKQIWKEEPELLSSEESNEGRLSKYREDKNTKYNFESSKANEKENDEKEDESFEKQENSNEKAEKVGEEKKRSREKEEDDTINEDSSSESGEEKLEENNADKDEENHEEIFRKSFKLPNYIQTKPIYPGEGKWAVKGTKHKPFKLKPVETKKHSHEEYEDSLEKKPDGYEVFKENERFFDDYRNSYRKSIDDFPFKFNFPSFFDDDKKEHIKAPRLNEYVSSDSVADNEENEDTGRQREEKDKQNKIQKEQSEENDEIVIDKDYQKEVLQKEKEEENKEETQNKEDFVPIRVYTQIRRIKDEQHLPPDDEEPRLREVIDKKTSRTVYTEEGYEDSAYDHAGHEKQAENNEGEADYAKEAHNSHYEQKPKPKYNQEKDDEEVDASIIVDKHLDEIGEDDQTSDGTSSKKLTLKKLPFKDDLVITSEIKLQKTPKQIQKHKFVKIIPKFSDGKNLKIRKKRYTLDLPKIEVDTDFIDSIQTEVEKDDRKEKELEKKYPYYKNHKNRFSPLRYAENLKNIPKKIPGELSFYKQANKLVECSEIPTHINPIPDRVKKAEDDVRKKKNEKTFEDSDSTEESNDEISRRSSYSEESQSNENKDNNEDDQKSAQNVKKIEDDEEESSENDQKDKNIDLPYLPRIKNLGDKIDCFKSRYFGVDPLDSPFFKEEDVEVPEPIFDGGYEHRNDNLIKHNEVNQEQIINQDREQEENFSQSEEESQEKNAKQTNYEKISNSKNQNAYREKKEKLEELMPQLHASVKSINPKIEKEGKNIQQESSQKENTHQLMNFWFTPEFNGIRKFNKIYDGSENKTKHNLSLQKDKEKETFTDRNIEDTNSKDVQSEESKEEVEILKDFVKQKEKNYSNEKTTEGSDESENSEKTDVITQQVKNLTKSKEENLSWQSTEETSDERKASNNDQNSSDKYTSIDQNQDKRKNQESAEKKFLINVEEDFPEKLPKMSLSTGNKVNEIPKSIYDKIKLLQGSWEEEEEANHKKPKSKIQDILDSPFQSYKVSDLIFQNGGDIGNFKKTDEKIKDESEVDLNNQKNDLSKHDLRYPKKLVEMFEENNFNETVNVEQKSTNTAENSTNQDNPEALALISFRRRYRPSNLPMLHIFDISRFIPRVPPTLRPVYRPIIPKISQEYKTIIEDPLENYNEDKEDTKIKKRKTTTHHSRKDEENLASASETKKVFSEVQYKEEIGPEEQLNVFADVINNIRNSSRETESSQPQIEYSNPISVQINRNTQKVNTRRIKVPTKRKNNNYDLRNESQLAEDSFNHEIILKRENDKEKPNRQLGSNKVFDLQFNEEFQFDDKLGMKNNAKLEYGTRLEHDSGFKGDSRYKDHSRFKGDSRFNDDSKFKGVTRLKNESILKGDSTLKGNSRFKLRPKIRPNTYPKPNAQLHEEKRNNLYNYNKNRDENYENRTHIEITNKFKRKRKPSVITKDEDLDSHSSNTREEIQKSPVKADNEGVVMDLEDTVLGLVPPIRKPLSKVNTKVQAMNTYPVQGMRPPKRGNPISYADYQDLSLLPTKKNVKRRTRRSPNKPAYLEFRRNGQASSSEEKEDEEDDYVPHRPRNYYYDEETGKIIYNKKPYLEEDDDDQEYVVVEVEDTSTPPRTSIRKHKKKKQETDEEEVTFPSAPLIDYSIDRRKDFNYLEFVKKLKSNPEYKPIYDLKSTEKSIITTSTTERSTSVPEFLNILAKIKSSDEYKPIEDKKNDEGKNIQDNKEHDSNSKQEDINTEEEEKEETKNQEERGSPIRNLPRQSLQIFDISEYLPIVKNYKSRTNLDTSKISRGGSSYNGNSSEEKERIQNEETESKENWTEEDLRRERFFARHGLKDGSVDIRTVSQKSPIKTINEENFNDTEDEDARRRKFLSKLESRAKNKEEKIHVDDDEDVDDAHEEDKRREEFLAKLQAREKSKKPLKNNEELSELNEEDKRRNRFIARLEERNKEESHERNTESPRKITETSENPNVKRRRPVQKSQVNNNLSSNVRQSSEERRAIFLAQRRRNPVKSTTQAPVRNNIMRRRYPTRGKTEGDKKEDEVVKAAESVLVSSEESSSSSGENSAPIRNSIFRGQRRRVTSRPILNSRRFDSSTRIPEISTESSIVKRVSHRKESTSSRFETPNLTPESVTSEIKPHEETTERFRSSRIYPKRNRIRIRPTTDSSERRIQRRHQEENFPPVDQIIPKNHKAYYSPISSQLTDDVSLATPRSITPEIIAEGGGKMMLAKKDVEIFKQFEEKKKHGGNYRRFSDLNEEEESENNEKKRLTDVVPKPFFFFSDPSLASNVNELMKNKKGEGVDTRNENFEGEAEEVHEDILIEKEESSDKKDTDYSYEDEVRINFEKKKLSEREKVVEEIESSQVKNEEVDIEKAIRKNPKIIMDPRKRHYFYAPI